MNENYWRRIQNGSTKKKIIIQIVSLVVAAVIGTSATEAQQSGKVFRIGFLDNSTASGMATLIDPFRQELHKLGWIERKNLAIEYRFGDGNNERLPELAAELVRLKIDVMVVTGEPVAAAKKATTTSPS